MKGHKLFNKAVAGVLTLALALGIAPAAIGGGIEAYADTATHSVSTYATKTQLTDGTFEPKADGTATNIGKIKFGGKAWYLLGGSGDNVDVFAAEKFNTVVFQPTYSANLTPDESLWATVTYTNGDKPSTVYCNNYGTSDLRKTLQDLASGDTFNSVEKSMLPSEGIEVTTSDLKNKAEDDTTNLTYTTKDKLYVASAGDNVFTEWGTTIEVAGKKLNIASTYTSGNWFWLRSPSSDHYSDALVILPGNYVSRSNVSYTYGGVLPASNLDFSSVLFASAAPAEVADTAKTVIDSDVMNLRLAATDSTAVTKDALGSVSVDANSGEITATKGTAASVTLVVQGNDGANDWYYAKAFTDETVTVNADDIATDLDLTNCKVWLEASDANGNIYATEPTTVCNVTFMNNNGTPDSLQVVEAGSKLTAPSITKAGYKLDGWYQNDDFTGEAWNFDEDTVTGDMTLYAKWVKADKDNDKGGSDNDKGGSDSDNAGSGSDNNGSSSNGAAGSDSDTSDSSAGTGDDANVLGLLALLTLAGAGAGTVFIRRRHN